MLMTDIPKMLVSEKTGWEDIDRAHTPHRWYFRSVVLPMSLLPPTLYAYAEVVHPGLVFPLSVPAITPTQLAVFGTVLFGLQLAMVSYMAMLIQRMAIGRDHDPGYDGAYALAAISPVPLWLSSLSLLASNAGFVALTVTLALLASIALLRHGTKPLLHIRDDRTAHYIADVVTLVGVATWIGLIIVAGLLSSIMLVWWNI